MKQRLVQHLVGSALDLQQYIGTLLASPLVGRGLRSALENSTSCAFIRGVARFPMEIALEYFTSQYDVMLMFVESDNCAKGQAMEIERSLPYWTNILAKLNAYPKDVVVLISFVAGSEGAQILLDEDLNDVLGLLPSQGLM